MFKILIKSKILLSIWVVSLIILISLFFFIPYITNKNLNSFVIDNSRNSVEHIKLTRTYYLNSVVNDIKNTNSDLVFLADHINNPKALPLPATIIHDLSDLYSKNSGVKFRTYSNYPFKNRESRELSKKDKKILSDIEKKGLVVLKDKIDNKLVLRVAIADYMSDESCVKCHNSHPDKTWNNNKWKKGDIRGVIEVITPLEKAIKKNENMRDMILFFIFIVFTLLIIYYSYMLVKREDELLKINEILDKRVKNELEKNRQKEQILLQKAKLSSLGEMINSIAHQWKQPLNEMSSLLLNLQLRYKLNKLDNDFFEKKITKSENILLFMSDTIEEFRDFFKVDKKKSSFSIKQVCEDTINILSMTLENNSIEVICDFDDEFKIYGYKNQFAQVILNILLNSKDAIINNQIKNAFISIKLKKNKNKLDIEISDNALGIKAELIDNIFDSYFTTKEEGSGIGLYISKIIIEKNFKGLLSVRNTKQGACFNISIPLN